MPLLRVQTLLQHPVAVSDRSFVPHPLLNIELDRIHAVWGCIQSVESKSETDYCELTSQSVTFSLS